MKDAKNSLASDGVKGYNKEKTNAEFFAETADAFDLVLDALNQANRELTGGAFDIGGETQLSRKLPERNRALRKGEMVNKFKSKVDWVAYYQKLNDPQFNPDFYDDGEITTMRLGDQKLTLEMQSNGEFSVIGVEKENGITDGSVERIDRGSQNGSEEAELSAKRYRNSGGRDRGQYEQERRNSDESSSLPNAERSSKGDAAVLSEIVQEETPLSRKLPSTIRGGVFPQSNKYPYSDANTVAMKWANNTATETGARALISFNNHWYEIEKYDSAPNGYYINDAVSTADYNKAKEEINEYNAGKAESVPTIGRILGELNTVERRERSVDSSSVEGTGAMETSRGLGAKALQRGNGQNISNGNRDNERGGEDISRETARLTDSPVSQEISSAKTSIKQIPALFKDKNVSFGKVNIDIGGGRFDLATEYLAKQGDVKISFPTKSNTCNCVYRWRL